MYHIEVLPSDTINTTPGWAYVPDTGIDPSKVPIVPSGARKRARISYVDERAAPQYQDFHSQTPLSTAGHAGGHENRLSAREQNRITKHLQDLDRENYRDVKIEVPGKSKDVVQRGLRPGRMTPAVRKILGSQKGWANYLDDEVARVQGSRGSVGLVDEAVVVSEVVVGEKGGGECGGFRGKGLKGEVEGVEVHGPKGKARGGRRRNGSAAQTTADEGIAESAEDAMDLDETQLVPSDDQPQTDPPPQPVDPTPLPPDIANLIEPDIPTMPSEEEIETLLRQPPLSWHQARAGPSTSTAPPRRFCEICGYWGRVRCMKCGQRVCGLECLRAHEDARCLKFYA